MSLDPSKKSGPAFLATGLLAQIHSQKDLISRQFCGRFPKTHERPSKMPPIKKLPQHWRNEAIFPLLILVLKRFQLRKMTRRWDLTRLLRTPLINRAPWQESRLQRWQSGY